MPPLDSSVYELLPTAGTLTGWITDLRAHLDRGELATLAPVDLGYGMMPAERIVRIMLADLDDLADLAPDEADAPGNIVRRASLFADFYVLRSVLG